MVNFLPGSDAEKVWIRYILPAVQAKTEAVQLHGVAPRSGNERRLLKLLHKHNIVKRINDTVGFMDCESGDEAL